MFIKELREERKLSQEALAKAIGTSQKNISRWENGEHAPSYLQLIKLAVFFDCSIDEIVGWDRNMSYFALESAKKVKQTDSSYGKLSDEECELLDYFRNASDDDKKSILRIASSLSVDTASSSKKSKFR